MNTNRGSVNKPDSNIRNKSNMPPKRNSSQRTEIFHKSSGNYNRVNTGNIRKKSSESKKTACSAKENEKSEFKIRMKNFFTPKMTVLFVLAGAFLIFAICMSVNIIIGVKSVTVEGNNLVTDEEILDVSGISEKSGYFSYNTRKIEKKILENVPCVTEVKINRSILGNVKINISEKKASWYTFTSNEYFALSDELEVIKKSDERDFFIEKGLVRLDFPKVKSAILGNKIEFSDDGRDLAFVDVLLQGIKKSDMYESDRINQVCIENKFNIFVVADLKYKIFLGKSNDTENKLFMAENILKNEKFDSDDHWELDVSNSANNSQFTSRLNEELDFSYLMPKNKK